MNTEKISGLIDSVWMHIGRADVARHQGEHALMEQELADARALLNCVDTTQKINREFLSYVTRFLARYEAAHQVSA